jgi:hypothetical protein
MSFKVKDLAVGLPGLQVDEGSTCTTLTKPTGSECINSIYWHGTSRQQNLAALKSQLSRAMTRA